MMDEETVISPAIHHGKDMNASNRIAAALFGLLVMYVLSIGPVAKAYWNTFPDPPWLEIYRPLGWMADHVPLAGKMLDTYIELWNPRSARMNTRYP